MVIWILAPFFSVTHFEFRYEVEKGKNSKLRIELIGEFGELTVCWANIEDDVGKFSLKSDGNLKRFWRNFRSEIENGKIGLHVKIHRKKTVQLEIPKLTGCIAKIISFLFTLNTSRSEN